MTSPFLKPRAARPAATRSTPRSSAAYVRVRQLGPSISAGFAPRSAARSSTRRCSGTSGTATSGCRLRKIMGPERHYRPAGPASNAPGVGPGTLLHHPKPFVLGRHLEEVAEPLLEYFRSAPRRRDPTDADPLVRCGKAPEVPPDGPVALEAPQNVLGDLPFRSRLRVPPVVECMLDAFQAEPRHAARDDQPAHPLAVHGREAARRPARREALGVAIRVDRLEEAVDPAVAQRLVHGVVVRDARLAALLLVVDEPDLGSGAVVLGKPPAPFAAIRGVESLADVHRPIVCWTRREGRKGRRGNVVGAVITLLLGVLLWWYGAAFELEGS